ncbi:uroporphyrinogen decarboxylase [Lichenihabitans sp. Uapishka_5]|uniref:uroporphyrinogen decarboxylase n=1 Tax=Lichenihabitans sp. Uapishka_5 TaxID=3037302 RepID=UPI0029E803BA|nr:uroporphyrinogen decarboxylase [Lichenihabitans sp. Uapishka_5]MDX7951646.1 uroporphyrinogen decarboxylase [Lichenihabitans sp. Uapishka_5]
MSADKPFLRVLDGAVASGPPPVWLMRQAGRYLPEYRAIRATAPSFLDFCYTPRLAVEATLQPIRRFGFDAAILFSDILVVPDALGQAVSFETGHGPRLEPVTSESDFAALRTTLDLDRLAPVFETIATLKALLPRETALIGFCGAPWTVASYMVAGRGTPDQGPARRLAYADPALFGRMIDRLVEASITYLDRQFEAGVDAVQVFDSWAGVLPVGEYETWCLEPLRAIVTGLRRLRPGARIIGFPRAGASQILAASRTGVTALSLDTPVDPAWANAALPPGLPVQGNLDPLALIAGGAALDRAVDRIREGLAGRPHVFNLGHGILPETPVPHVERMLSRLRGGA